MIEIVRYMPYFLQMILVVACAAAPISDGRTTAQGRQGEALEGEEVYDPATPRINHTTTSLPSSSQTAILTATPAPTWIATAVATATPHPLHAYTIPAYQEGAFPGGMVTILNTMDQNPAFTRYYIAYPSSDLTITGTMHLPAGSDPFPVLILLHGYFERDQYYVGADTWQAAEFFAQHGYLVLAPDLRSWGESDAGLSLFHMGLTADVLHLISSLPSIPQADPDRLGLWGHSMGGGIATKILTIDDRPLAAVLYAPNSADDADLIARWGPGCLPGQSEAAGDNCNPGEFIPADTPQSVIDAYLSATGDPDFLRRVAPYYYLDQISVPVQIHIGSADGARRQYTPPEWSAKLSSALQEAGVDVTTYSYAGQGHYFQGEAWTNLLERSLVLFDETLRPPSLAE